LPGVAATSGNNEITICDGGTSSTTVPGDASMSNGSAGGQSEINYVYLLLNFVFILLVNANKTYKYIYVHMLNVL
jgi:hypothetical protein